LLNALAGGYSRNLICKGLDLAGRDTGNKDQSTSCNPGQISVALVVTYTAIVRVECQRWVCVVLPDLLNHLLRCDESRIVARFRPGRPVQTAYSV
jgi:hypothetical protein